ncbi:MAG: hypothetical protein NSGCLCUN01_03838 [uncultured Clostridium sp.]
MGKTELTKEIEKALRIETSKWFGCAEVTIGWYGKQRVDFMTMDSKEIFRCYEIKISKSDFKSKHGHNFVGHFNYYVVPKELYESIKDEVSKEIGVYIWNGKCLSLVKRPKKKELEVDISILKNSMIRSLYRDTSKIITSENIDIMNGLKSRLAKAEKENRDNLRQYRQYRDAIYFELGREKFNKFQEKYDL